MSMNDLKLFLVSVKVGTNAANYESIHHTLIKACWPVAVWIAKFPDTSTHDQCQECQGSIYILSAQFFQGGIEIIWSQSIVHLRI